MKWDRAIIQQGAEVRDFLLNYFAKPDRNCAMISGAGFDPRTLALPQRLAGHPKLKVLCLREERPKPQPRLRPLADEHAKELLRLFGANCTVSPLDIFDGAGGVVGGRRVVGLVSDFIAAAEAKQPLTDVLVDISALSCGVFFPIVAQLLERTRLEKRKWNLHLFVAENPAIDIRIRGEIMDTVSHIHGFLSRGSLSQTEDHALLWAPVFSEGNDTQMRRIYDLINQPPAVVDILPIIPFPGVNPRRPDELVWNYRELIGDWQIDPRHFLYAAESDPLDSYRSICGIDQLRASTYGKLGGSSTILSPLGSKMLSVGLMLAAIERTLRVVYVECLGYEEVSVPTTSTVDPWTLPLTHVWLAGEVYGEVE